VLAIGGLKEKVLAAHHANIHNLIIPLENKKDLAEIPEKIRQAIRFTIVDSMDQVIDTALLPPPEPAQEQEREEPTNSLNGRLSTRRRREHRRPLPPEDEEDSEHVPEQELILPPDHLTGENYPSAHAEDPPTNE
jgi:ATP-dependent Lon protease